MTDLTFPGYRSFEAGPDDQYRAKWQAVRATFGTASLQLTVEPLNFPAIVNLNGNINGLVRYTPEASGQDQWQSPSDTISLRTGDCEDYAILKYATLLKSGLAEDSLRIVIGEIKSIAGNQPHAWCAAYLDGAWRAMDQKFDQLIKVADYINWLPLAAMHGETVVLYAPGETFTIADRLRDVA